MSSSKPSESVPAVRKAARPHSTMSLQGLREALSIPQIELGDRLGVKQAAVSRMERRRDMHLSHLRRVIEAMGGTLIITASFPDIDIFLTL